MYASILQQKPVTGLHKTFDGATCCPWVGHSWTRLSVWWPEDGATRK